MLIYKAYNEHLSYDYVERDKMYNDYNRNYSLSEIIRQLEYKCKW